jgi:hypothetical protein
MRDDDVMAGRLQQQLQRLGGVDVVVHYQHAQLLRRQRGLAGLRGGAGWRVRAG